MRSAPFDQMPYGMKLILLNTLLNGLCGKKYPHSNSPLFE
jgi:hypothetical protein